MQNRWLRVVLVLVGLLLVLCLCLGASVFVVRLNGRSEGRPLGLFRRMFNLPREHGAIGRIQRIDTQTLTLELPNGTIENVLVNQDTRIERSRKRIPLPDLKVNDRVLVIGSPDRQGRIDANWIHVFGQPNPEPNQMTPTLPNR